MNLTGRKILVVVALAGAVFACRRSAQQDFEKGVAYYREQKYSKAIPYLEQSLARAVPTAQALNFLGVCRLQEGKTDEAIQSFRAAVKLDAGYIPARYNLALADLDSDHPEDAFTQLRYVVQSDAAPADALYYLGIAYLRSSAWVQARQALEKYQQHDPKSLDVLNNLGVVSARLRDFKQAGKYFGQCLGADPKFAPAYLNLAVIEHRYLGNHRDALGHYQKYLDLLPKGQQREDVRVAIAQIEQESAAKPKPVEIASTQLPKTQETSKTAPAEPVPTGIVAQATAPRPQESPSAKPKPVAASPIAPSGPEAVAQPTPPIAKRRTPIPTRTLKAGNRTRATAYFNQAVQLQQQGKLPAAISSYGKAISVDPTCSQAYYNLAIAYRDSRQFDRALDNYELALMADNKFTDARYNYAILLQDQGCTKDAIAQYETLLQQAPNEAAETLHLAVATLYVRDPSTFDKAREHYQAYLKLAPNSPAARDIRDWLDHHR
jgi:tetratricopeptide (TPR) repeat protein